MYEIMKTQTIFDELKRKKGIMGRKENQTPYIAPPSQDSDQRCHKCKDPGPTSSLQPLAPTWVPMELCTELMLTAEDPSPQHTGHLLRAARKWPWSVWPEGLGSA